MWKAGAFRGCLFGWVYPTLKRAQSVFLDEEHLGWLEPEYDCHTLASRLEARIRGGSSLLRALFAVHARHLATVVFLRLAFILGVFANVFIVQRIVRLLTSTNALTVEGVFLCVALLVLGILIAIAKQNFFFYARIYGRLVRNVDRWAPRLALNVLLADALGPFDSCLSQGAAPARNAQGSDRDADEHRLRPLHGVLVLHCSIDLSASGCHMCVRLPGQQCRLTPPFACSLQSCSS